MSAIANVSLRVDKLPKEKFVKGKDGAVYYNFTVSINPKTPKPRMSDMRSFLYNKSNKLLNKRSFSK